MLPNMQCDLLFSVTMGNQIIRASSTHNLQSQYKHTHTHQQHPKMKFSIIATLITCACAFSPGPTKPAHSTLLNAKSTGAWFAPAAAAAAGWAVVANVAFAALEPVVFGTYIATLVECVSLLGRHFIWFQCV
jgi:hypothetical protein